MMVEEVKEHLLHTIIPFWKNLRDNEHGGYYGWLGYDLALDKKAVKGCILNSPDHLVLCQCIYAFKR